MNTKGAIVMLDQLDTADPERAHKLADDILLDWVSEHGGKEVAAAYYAVVKRASWWGAS